MKRIAASLLFVVYLGFFASVCANAFAEQHSDLCEVKDLVTAHTENGKTNTECCDYSFLSGKIRHEFHHTYSSASAKQKFAFTNIANRFIVSPAQVVKPAIYASAYINPDLYKRIFIKIRVLLI